MLKLVRRLDAVDYRHVLLNMKGQSKHVRKITAVITPAVPMSQSARHKANLDAQIKIVQKLTSDLLSQAFLLTE
jgi:hypothetical protein